MYAPQQYNFEVRIRVGSGLIQKVTIQADTGYTANLLAETQYGKENIVGYPVNMGPVQN